MPSTPHLSSKLLVLVLSVFLTGVATWLTLALPETPSNPLSWPRIFLGKLAAGIRHNGRERLYWSVLLVYSGLVSALHFGGLHFDVYLAIEQWDFLTHVLGGLGVAMIFYLTFHLDRPERRLRWIVPAVLAVGAGFEVYEFVFKNFWYNWSLRYYLVDTLLDLGTNVLGSLIAVGTLKNLR